MLSALRKRKNSPVIVVLLGLVAFLMIGFGVSFQGSRSTGVAASVNGETISVREFESRYTVAYRERGRQGRDYTPERAETEGLRTMVMHGLMTEKILRQKGASLGLAADDAALRTAITEDDLFHTNGVFDPDRYERVVSYYSSTPQRFEQTYRDEWVGRPLRTLIQLAYPSEKEVRAFFERIQNRMNIEFVQIESDRFEDQVEDVTDADVERWRSETEDPDQEIKDFYSKNRSQRYDVPKQVCMQHILVRSTPETPPEQRAQHMKKIQQALSALKGGADFAQVAKDYSEEASTAARGGDAGCFGPGQSPEAMEQAAFGLEVGEYSGVVDAKIGLYIIRVYEIKPAIRKKLEEVQDEIARELARSIRTSELARTKAEQLLRAARNAPDLTAAVASLSPPAPYEVQETGPFIQGQAFVRNLGEAKEVAQAAWKLTEEAPVPEAPIKNEKGWVVIRFKERTRPDESMYEIQKGYILDQLRQNKMATLSKGWTDHLREQADPYIDPVQVSYSKEAQAIRQSQRQP